MRLPLTKDDDRALMRHALSAPMRDEKGNPILDEEGKPIPSPYPPNLLHIAKVIKLASYITPEQREELTDSLEITVLQRIREHQDA